MQAVNLRSFKKKVIEQKRRFRYFLSKLEKNPPRKLDQLAEVVNKEVWQEVDCLSCANCCKTMTPTFNPQDLKRISAHFKMSIEEFQKKWLRREKGGERDGRRGTEESRKAFGTKDFSQDGEETDDGSPDKEAGEALREFS